jgi:hypothetical protein
MDKQLAQHRTQEQGSRIAAAAHLNYEFAMYKSQHRPIRRADDGRNTIHVIFPLPGHKQRRLEKHGRLRASRKPQRCAQREKQIAEAKSILPTFSFHPATVNLLHLAFSSLQRPGPQPTTPAWSYKNTNESRLVVAAEFARFRSKQAS